MATKRPYKKPKLVDYGSIPARTLSVSASGSITDIKGIKLAKKFT
jgi:hypothetical protein